MFKMYAQRCLMVRWLLFGLALTVPLYFASFPAAIAQEAFVPPYITDGLHAYETQGYEAAVAVWLKGSPFENATAMASRINMFKNIEMLYGQYQGYEIVTTRHTDISNMVYVRMNYARTSSYIRFISIKRQGSWILSDIQLDRQQKYA